MNPIVIIVGLAVLAVVIYLVVKAGPGARRARAPAYCRARRVVGGERVRRFGLRDPWNLDSRYQGLADIGNGHDRYAFETLITRPTRSRRPSSATTSRRGKPAPSPATAAPPPRPTRRPTGVATSSSSSGVQFPHLFLRTEGLLDRIAGFIGFDDIDFESEEFSKRYFCKSDDRQFAYAVIHPQMMEWLMSRRYEGELKQGLLVTDATAAPTRPKAARRCGRTPSGSSTASRRSSGRTTRSTSRSSCPSRCPSPAGAADAVLLWLRVAAESLNERSHS